MIKVYHNPRCAKSREALQWLDDHQLSYEVVKYMEEGLRPDELEELLDLLDKSAHELIRTKEAIWKEQYADLDLNEDELIMVMVEEPRLMERPIVVTEDRAILARPTSALEALL